MTELSDMHHLWMYFGELPLLHLTLTLMVYQAGDWIYKRCHFHPLAHPILFAIVVLVLFLQLTGIQYETYFQGTQLIHFLLGPATVALAIPLYRAYEQIRQSAFAILIALFAGCFMAIVSAVVIGWSLGGTQETLLSLAPKSATTPIAMGVADEIGGIASLTAVCVILTGILGAIFSTGIFNLLQIDDARARGFAVGLVAHGVGTSYKLRINEVTGAFAGLAMGINGLATAIFTPVLIPHLLYWLNLPR
jgi:predicted murein hydrolase (TIGR00659 family)